MLKTIFSGMIGAILFAGAASAQTCGPYTFTFTNGTTADATQVNANFNSILGCANTSLAPLASPHFSGEVIMTSGGASTDPLVLEDPTGNITAFFREDSTNDGEFFLRSGSSPSTNAIQIASVGVTYFNGGNLAIGSTSADALLSLGTAGHAIKLAVTDNSSSNLYGIGAKSSSLTFGAGIGVDGTPQMVLTNGGALGIGTTTPAKMLEVDGGAQFDGNVFLTGSLTTASSNNLCLQNSTNEITICATSASSIRYKEDVKAADFGLKEIMAMRPVTFKWKGNGERDIGLVAEEIAAINPLFATYQADGKVQGVKYAQLTAVLVNAVKQLEATNEDQARKIEHLDSRVSELEGKMKSLQNTASNGEKKLASASAR